MLRVSHLVLPAVLFGPWACTPGPEPSDETVEFVVEDDSRALCRGTGAHLQTYIEHVFDFLAAAIPEDFQVPVYMVDDPPCLRNACYHPDEDRVYVGSADLDQFGVRTSGVLRHEVTHAIVDRVWGQSAPFFDEGLAESLTWGRAGDWAAPPTLTPVGDQIGRTVADLDYTAAARFVRFLIDTRGLDTFKELFQGAGGLSRDGLLAWFDEVYGEDFAALEAEFLSGPPRCTFQVDICDVERAEAVGDGWSHGFAASCDDPEFYGSVGPEDAQIATQRTLEIEVAGTYRLVSDAHLFLARCGGCDVQRVREYRFGVDADIELAAGFYTLELVAEGDGVLEVELTAR